MTGSRAIYRAARYARLSREDGDKPESDSIVNQLHMIADFCAGRNDIRIIGDYADDGYTGTNFQRPDFQRMLADMETGTIDCVIVKDLSRFGRDYIDMGYYLERYFPARGVRFISIADHVDSLRGAYDMMLPLKNIFNTQYARDISEKVRSAFRTKQRRGDFVGAFASYGYLKDPENRNRLIVDPAASLVVHRIFSLAADGVGQVRIAKLLNEDGIPCPSEYKRLMGERYANSHKLDTTCYWTYATIHRMLGNEVYIGHMVANRSHRPAMHGKARAAERGDWIVVPDTHEPIVSRELWDAVQAQRTKNTRPVDFSGHVGLFAGFLVCGDCGRSMCKTTWDDRVTYSCGSYRRYGTAVCSRHCIRQEELASILLEDLNRVLQTVEDLPRLAEENRRPSPENQRAAEELARLDTGLARLRRLKQAVYEDYREGLLGRDEFLRYRGDYARQEQTLQKQRDLGRKRLASEPPENDWADTLAERGALTELDRATLAQTVEKIRIFEDRRIEITYRFSEELRAVLEPGEDVPVVDGV